jgi:hypothetical protein
MQRGALQPLSNATHSEGLALSQNPASIISLGGGVLEGAATGAVNERDT